MTEVAHLIHARTEPKHLAGLIPRAGADPGIGTAAIDGREQFGLGFEPGSPRLDAIGGVVHH